MRCDLGVLNLAPVCIFAGAEANLQLPREKHLEHMSSGFTLVLFWRSNFVDFESAAKKSGTVNSPEKRNNIHIFVSLIAFSRPKISSKNSKTLKVKKGLQIVI